MTILLGQGQAMNINIRAERTRAVQSKAAYGLLAVAMLALGGQPAEANTVEIFTFVPNGYYGGLNSGTLTIDPTAGTVLSVDVVGYYGIGCYTENQCSTFGATRIEFNALLYATEAGERGGSYEVQVGSTLPNVGLTMNLFLLTSPTPRSLVGLSSALLLPLESSLIQRCCFLNDPPEMLIPLLTATPLPGTLVLFGSVLALGGALIQKQHR